MVSEKETCTRINYAHTSLYILTENKWQNKIITISKCQGKRASKSNKLQYPEPERMMMMQKKNEMGNEDIPGIAERRKKQAHKEFAWTG